MGSAACDLERSRGADSSLRVSLGTRLGSSRARVSLEVRIMEGPFVGFEAREREGYLWSLKSRSEMARPCWKKLRWRFEGRFGETVEFCRAC